MPQNTLLCIGLSIALWYLTYQDYKYREVDIRVCGIVFFLGLIIHSDTFVLHFYIGLTCFLILHVIHEKLAKVVKIVETVGEMTYYNPYPEADIDNAPAYIPMFTAVMAVILLYYMLGFPIPEVVYNSVFEPLSLSYIPWVLWLFPFILICFTVYYWNRNRKAIKNGNNIVYYGFGDGDVYFIGAMIGVMGFFFTLITVFGSLFIAIIMLKKWKNNGEVT